MRLFHRFLRKRNTAPFSWEKYVFSGSLFFLGLREDNLVDDLSDYGVFTCSMYFDEYGRCANYVRKG